LDIDHKQQQMNGDPVSRQGNRCLKAGMWGSILAAICCTTPLLAISLASVGLAAIAPRLDYILFPMLLFFLFLALYGWVKGRREGNNPR
jgi:mercuric ion transport protein